MIRTLVILAVVAALGAGAAWLAERPGSMTIEWLGWRIDGSAALLAFCLAVVAVLLALVLRLIGGVRRAPKRWAAARRVRRRERGYRALTQGMVAIAAGDAEEASRQARRADALLHDPPLTMLLSAQAAQLGGDEAAARRYFTAMLERKETAFLGVRGLLMQAEREGNRDESRRLIERAFAMRPETPWVLEALIEDQTRAAKWADALATLDRAERARAVTKDSARLRRAALLLALAAERRAAGDAGEARSLARKAHRAAPDFQPAAILRAALLADAGRNRAASNVIEGAWARAPHPELAQIYGRIRAEDALARVRRIERLIAADPEHREARLALAEPALDAKLWGIARARLAPLAADTPTVRVCRLMARLEAEEHGDAAAERAWLLRAATARPDPGWVCRGCGAIAAEWSALCTQCGALATLDWRTPDRARANALAGGEAARLVAAPAATAPTPEPPAIDAPLRGA